MQNDLYVQLAVISRYGASLPCTHPEDHSGASSFIASIRSSCPGRALALSVDCLHRQTRPIGTYYHLGSLALTKLTSNDLIRKCVAHLLRYQSISTLR